MKREQLFLKIKYIVMFLFFIIFVSCSKPAGKTTTKLRIFSGNFSAILTSKANNGLLLYGKSSDGKSFTKKIDDNTIDLVFPNGSWNFYAISWELGTATGNPPNFTGKTYCGQASATFTGADATVNLNLTNANCNNPVFSANTKFDGTNYVFPKANIYTCKDISGTLSPTACDQNSGASYNKGYATSYRIIASEYTNFGGGSSPNKIAQSPCVRAEFNTLTGGILTPTDTALFNDLHIQLHLEMD